MGSSALAPNLQWIQTAFPELSGIVDLAAGGQKLVFAATHPTDGDVVLKFFSPGTDAEVVRRELLAVKGINSARTPRILADGVVQSPVGPLFWFREQRVIGASARERLASGGPWTPQAVLVFCSDVIESLRSAESVDIVHRDVKPDNVIVDAAGAHWLIDFGLARHLQLTSVTNTGLGFGKGTPGYAPPEQFKNYKKLIDPRADLFALGVSAIELSTGGNPFWAGATTALDVLRRVDSAPAPLLRLALVKGDEFCDLVAAMTQRRREHRPASVADAADWLAEIRTAEGI